MLVKKVWNIISTVFVAVVVILAILLAGVRLIGFTPYSVLSGSMTPQYHVGDLVYVKKTAPEAIEPGDVITFVADENLTVVTHRVMAADRTARCFTTKGDANNSEDGAPVLYENVLGTVRFSVPKLGYLSNYLSTTSGRYASIAVLLAVLLSFLLPELLVMLVREKNEAEEAPPKHPG